MNNIKKITLTVSCTLLLISIFAQEKGIINNSNTPFMKLKTTDLEDCQWTEGFWADRMTVAHETMVPNLGRLMNDPNIIHAYDNFKVAAGLQEGEFRGWSFHDGDFYKYVESLAYTYLLTKDENINKQMDEIIAVIAKAQQANGYIHTMIQIGHGISGYKHSSENRFKKTHGAFEKDSKHEFYNFGHLMTAACAHFRATGKLNFLNIAIKASDLLYNKFHIPSAELASLDWNPPHYMGLVEMYRTTGDKRYLDVAESFINMLGTGKAQANPHRGLDHTQKRIPFREVTEAVGHAGHGNYMYSGVADVYAETGDKSLLKALDRIWENIIYKKMYVTGATGPHHYAVSTQKKLMAEAYGKAYDLPNLGAYNETCANIGNAMFNWRMFLLNGEARYADIVELILYNSALSGISLEGKDFFYTNPLKHLHGHQKNTKDEGIRSPHMSVFCCPPNIIRTIANINGLAYTISEDGIWVNLYGSNTLDTELADGQSIKLKQESNYPWDGLVKIIVKNPRRKNYSIMLRIPSWTNHAVIHVNGKPVEGEIQSGHYVNLNRKWKKGDVIELDMQMTPQLIQANPYIEETRNQVAIKHGPLVYCIESIDLPNALSISDVLIPQDITLTARFEKDLLSGVNVLEGEAEITQQEDWSNTLYKRLRPLQFEKTNIRLIPYFAWSNRGQSDMTVWLPLKY